MTAFVTVVGGLIVSHAVLETVQPLIKPAEAAVPQPGAGLGMAETARKTEPLTEKRIDELVEAKMAAKEAAREKAAQEKASLVQEVTTAVAKQFAAMFVAREQQTPARYADARDASGYAPAPDDYRRASYGGGPSTAELAASFRNYRADPPPPTSPRPAPQANYGGMGQAGPGRFVGGFPGPGMPYGGGMRGFGYPGPRQQLAYGYNGGYGGGMGYGPGGGYRGGGGGGRHR